MTQVVLAVTFGSFSYGYCASILANIFTHAEFFEYLDLDPEGPNASHANSLIAAFNALLYVGGFVGCCLYPISSSRLGRRFPLGVGSVLVIVGGALQAGTTHNAMMCVARVVTGVGIGHFLPGCPLYQAEVAPAHNRGFLVGLHAAVVGAGFAVAQWMGVAFFNVPGQAGWRVPLALQCVSPLFMLCIVPFLPESPRWRKYQNSRTTVTSDNKQCTWLVRLTKQRRQSCGFTGTGQTLPTRTHSRSFAPSKPSSTLKPRTGDLFGMACEILTYGSVSSSGSW